MGTFGKTGSFAEVETVPRDSDAHTEPEMSATKKPAPWSLIIFATTVAVVTIMWLVQLDLPMPFFGDQALLEIATRDSVHFQQTLGAHSRLGGFHPGPSYTYLLAPLYWLTGYAPRSLLLGTFLINAACLFASVWLIRARTSEVVARWAVGVAGLYMVMLGSTTLWWLWNPNVLGPALILTTLLVADCTRGRVGSLIWAAVSGTFLIQAHVVMVAPVAVLAGVGMVGFVWARVARRRPLPANPVETAPPRSRRIRAVGALVGVVVLCLFWFPPLFEQFTAHGEGNLSHLMAVGQGHATLPPSWEKTHPVGQASAAVLRMLPVVFTGQDSLPAALTDLAEVPTPPVRIVVSVLLLLGTLAVGVVAFRKKLWFVACTAAATLLTTASAVVLQTRTAGPLYQYAIMWAVAIVVPTLMLAPALLPTRVLNGRLFAYFATTTAAVGCGVFALTITVQAPGGANLAPVELLAIMREANLAQPIDLTTEKSVWPVRSAVINLADKEGYQVLAGGASSQFPDRLRGGGSATQVIILPRTGPGSSPPAKARLLGSAKNYTMYQLGQ